MADSIRITVSMPYYRGHKYVRRAVDSILNQTYPHFRLIVVNDGDTDNAWEPLADIEDSRLVRFDLGRNMGRYYIDQMTLRACDTVWWTPHDHDDESVPERFAKLVKAIGQLPFAYSDSMVMTRDGRESYNRVWGPGKYRKGTLGTTAKYPAGLYQTEMLRRIGGPHPGSRGSYDTALGSLIFTKFDPVIVREPLYIVHKRNGSLSTGDKTGLKTQWRRRQRQIRKDLFKRVVHRPINEWAGLLKGSPQIEVLLEQDVERLRVAIEQSEG